MHHSPPEGGIFEYAIKTFPKKDHKNPTDAISTTTSLVWGDIAVSFLWRRGCLMLPVPQCLQFLQWTLLIS